MYRRLRKRKRQKLIEEFGKNPMQEPGISLTQKRMDKIRIYYEECKKHGKEPSIDEITWNDLEMDEVFLRINNTKSYMGEQVLYQRLHETGGEIPEGTEERLGIFCDVEQRVEIEEKLSAIGKKDEDYHMATFLMHPDIWEIKSGFFLHLLQLLLLICLLGSIVTEKIIFVAALVTIALINLFIYLNMKQKYEIYLYSLGSLKKILEFGSWMAADPKRKELFVTEELEQAIAELSRLSKRIIGIQNRKYAALSGDIMYICNDYIQGIMLLDLSAFNHIMKIIDKKQDMVLMLYRFAGNIDAEISIASFRKSMDTWCCPEFNDACVIAGRQISHPLLTEPTANDFALTGHAIITGDNASGKSTFMKALAINAVLAQTIHTCIAKSFSMPRLNIMTSMSLRDDISTGESYYMREAKYLKRMLDQAQGKIPSLYIIDEILRGTNTRERLAAASAILHYLENMHGFVLVATHDMELVYKMKDKYENYYFESQVVRSDIYFDYQIRKGIGGSSNAIALLSLLQFPAEVVSDAEKNLVRSSI